MNNRFEVKTTDCKSAYPDDSSQARINIKYVSLRRPERRNGNEENHRISSYSHTLRTKSIKLHFAQSL